MIPLELVYRSRPIQYPLLAAMKACKAWEQSGIELKSLKFVSGAAQSDPMLIQGECDFLFGSHISPYLHRFHGHPFVYLGSTVNWVDDVMVTKDPIRSLKEIEGKTLSESEKATPDRHHGSHPAGNHLLYLKREGADSHKIKFVPSSGRKSYLDVVEGRAFAAFASLPDDEEARRKGLHVLPLAPLPMVLATTLTTLWPTLEKRRDLCGAVAKAVLMGVHFIKTKREEMWEVMQEDVAVELGIEDLKVLEYLHNHNFHILEPRLYPTAEAIKYAFDLAVMEEPEIVNHLNPMSLWDLHLLRSIEESGFINKLYDGNIPGPGTVIAQ